jgi:hypothetical protein
MFRAHTAVKKGLKGADAAHPSLMQRMERILISLNQSNILLVAICEDNKLK